MANQTLAALAAATPATGGFFYGTQDGADRKFTLTAAGAEVLESASSGIKATIATEGLELTAEQCKNGIVYATLSDGYFRLPPIENGMSVTILKIGSGTLIISPHDPDEIFVDGSILVSAGGFQTLGQHGDKAVITYYSDNIWYAATNGFNMGV